MHTHYSYDHARERFLQTDPVGYQDDINLYAYVRNDPLNRTDPTGTEGAGCGLQGRVCPTRSQEYARSEARVQAGGRAETFGNAQRTNGPAGEAHARTSEQVAQSRAGAEGVGRVHMNESLRTVTGNPSAPNVRADVADVSLPNAEGVRTVNITEVRSPSQTSGELTQRYGAALRNLPEGFQGGTVRVVEPIVIPEVAVVPMRAPIEPVMIEPIIIEGPIILP